MLHGLSHQQLRRLRTLLSLWPLLDFVDYEIEDVRNFDPHYVGLVQINVQLKLLRNQSAFQKFLRKVPKNLQPQYIH
jgi:hypothetical protein